MNNEQDEQDEGPQNPEHSPQFSRQGAAMMNAPFWYQDIPDGPNYLPQVQARRKLHSDFQAALVAAQDYHSLDPKMREVWDKCEASYKKLEATTTA